MGWECDGGGGGEEGWSDLITAGLSSNRVIHVILGVRKDGLSITVFSSSHTATAQSNCYSCTFEEEGMLVWGYSHIVAIQKS